MTPDEERPDLIALIDLSPTDATRVCDAMANVGLEAVPHRLGSDYTDVGIGRAAVRIYVPRAQVRDARAVVEGVLPEYRTGMQDDAGSAEAPDEDRAFADIVAGLRADGFQERDMPRPPVPDPAAEDRYVPPEPPPLPRISVAAIAAWGAMVVGIVLIGVALTQGGVGIELLAGAALFIGGFAGLIARARDGRSESDDDGAVV